MSSVKDVRTPSQVQLFKQHFIAGAIGLSLSYSCMHPLDTIKTRIQADIAGGWRAIFSRETARSLGKGFFVSAMGAAGQGGARFSTYEFCKSQMLETTDGQRKKPWIGTIPATALSAVVGDLASSVIKVPREVVTAKLQTDYYSSMTSNGRATAGFVVRQTLLEEGPRGLFKGFWAIAARDSPFMIILLVSYENFKAFHHRSVREDLLKKMKTRSHHEQQVVAGAAFEELEADIPTFKSIMYGGISGFLAGYFTTPMDVLRTRMITQKTSVRQRQLSVVQVAKGMLDRVMSTHANPMQKSVQVYSTFFAGAIPRSFWWFGICGIFFPTYETLKSLMRPNEHKQ
ncbi:mitochondrial carrier domain-containing protein [Radiomyces spectabilis]|uniref:mitochondrial carrier domain-containing protein n=1 Tax=Radiomyces spectabilis TaxID=64574 RepID=UPI00221FBF1C|nr:mitochondrial carrier domain-containing protein [Radiomyces spectabilis]KAI8371725.1 mitochondrial carrier domain-containing protein [Radiomyces spectabilis]